MFMDLCDDVINIVKQWTPKKKYSKENGYRDDLLEFIRKKLNSQQNIFGPPEEHLIRPESGRHLADIGIDESIGIELKRNLKSKSEINRLDGQISDFARQYRCIIVVLCGEMSDETAEEASYRVKHRFSGRGFDLQGGPRVKVIRKDESSLGKKEDFPGSFTSSTFKLPKYNIHSFDSPFDPDPKKKNQNKDDDWDFL